MLTDIGWDGEPGRGRWATLIRATERHDATDDPGRAVLLDADLAVLGSEPAAYQAYVTGVRAEYAHVDDPGWVAGRGAVLRGLLDREPLYSTADGRGRWEARARANMTAELATLGPDVSGRRRDAADAHRDQRRRRRAARHGHGDAPRSEAPRGRRRR